MTNCCHNDFTFGKNFLCRHCSTHNGNRKKTSASNLHYTFDMTVLRINVKIIWTTYFVGQPIYTASAAVSYLTHQLSPYNHCSLFMFTCCSNFAGHTRCSQTESCLARSLIITHLKKSKSAVTFTFGRNFQYMWQLHALPFLHFRLHISTIPHTHTENPVIILMMMMPAPSWPLWSYTFFTSYIIHKPLPGHCQKTYHDDKCHMKQWVVHLERDPSFQRDLNVHENR